METVTQPERERLNPFVTPETAHRVKVACAVQNKTQGEVIDELVMRHLPPVPTTETESAS